MKRWIRGLAAAGLAAVAWNRLSRRWNADSVRPLRDDGNGSVDGWIAPALRAMHDADAEGELEGLLGTLRKEPERTLRAITSTYRHSSADDFPARWSLVYLADQIDLPQTLPWFAELAATEVPPERGIGGHGLSTVAEECKIRAAAIDGLERHAARDPEAATEALTSVIAQQQTFSVRALAALAVLAVHPDDETRGRLRELLGPEHEFALDIKRVNVTDVAQPDRPERPSTVRGAPPELGGTYAARRTPPWRRSPNTRS
jgi:hypothetical protein